MISYARQRCTHDRVLILALEYSGGSGPSHGQSSTTALSTGRSEPMFSSRSERLSSEDLSAGVGEVSPVSVTAGGGGGGGGGVETMTHRDQPPRQATGVSELIERKRHDTEIAVASSPRTAGTAAARADMVAKSGLSTTYDPTDSAARMDSPMKVIAAAARGHEDQVKLDLSDMKTFLTTPLPRGYGTLQCYIERDKSGFSRRMYPEYRLYMKVRQDNNAALLTSGIHAHAFDCRPSPLPPPLPCDPPKWARVITRKY